MKSNIITVLLLFIFSSLFGQQRIEDELIIQLKPGISGDAFFQSFDHERDLDESQIEFHTVSYRWRIHKLSLDKDMARTTLNTLLEHPDVEIAGFNFQLEPKAVTPNDALFSAQWGMEAINAPEVWEFATGGVTALGDTIVVANLEDTDIYHEDIWDNIWRNPIEIPNNNIDDDQNGYVDDYFGVNITNGRDNHPGNSVHGTQVTGIIGAKGNNEIGISGVNWNVKLMIVSNNLQFDEIIEGYEYIYDMRKRYNETNGEEGAFVVATNASFGAEGGPDTNPFFPTWCQLYEDLGQIGVLSAGATSNATVDIDDIGDMPTSCQSKHLIAVTDIDPSNTLRGGYSPENVDLGAPGSTVTSTTLADQYSPIGGTSASTPHVAGAIALLYSIPCTAWAQLAIDDPEMAATLMKGFILDGVSPLESLQDKTVSEGLLNLKGSLDLMQTFCGSFTGPLDFLKVKSNLASHKVTVEYQTPKNDPYIIRVFDAIGRELINMTVEPELFQLKSFEIDVSRFAQGAYFISIENNENIVSSAFAVY